MVAVVSLVAAPFVVGVGEAGFPSRPYPTPQTNPRVIPAL